MFLNYLELKRIYVIFDLIDFIVDFISFLLFVVGIVMVFMRIVILFIRKDFLRDFRELSWGIIGCFYILCLVY